MKKFALLTMAVLTVSVVNADSQLDEYKKWRENELKSYQNYLDENDKAFIKFLKAQWKSVEVEPAEKRDPAPKPKTFPKAPEKRPEPAPVSAPVPVPVKKQPDIAEKPIAKQPEQKPAPVIVQKTEPAKPVKKPVESKPVKTKPTASKPVASKPVIQKPKVVTKPPVVPPPELKSKSVRTAKFDFYGNPIAIRYPKNLKRVFAGKLNSDKIAAYWQYLASKEHKPTIQQLKDTAAALKLNDWGTAQLFNQFSKSILRQETSRRLTTWFLLVKAGFDARVAYNDKLHLLIPSKQDLFGVTFFKLSGKKYYAVNLSGKQLKPGKVFTYGGQHGAGSHILDFSQPNEFIAQGKQSKRALTFNYGGQSYKVNVDYPARYVAYFNSFPQLSLPNYFKAGLPAVTSASMLDQLRPVVAGQNEQEAVNRLLRFVQTAFKYKTDDQQFKEENYLFPLETLHYPYSDCDDRAALFAWLTESLLGLDVVILDYPGHVATAVNFSGKVKGDAWQYQGKRYVVADPTYINASAGMTMPQFAGKAPKVQPF